MFSPALANEILWPSLRAPMWPNLWPPHQNQLKASAGRGAKFMFLLCTIVCRPTQFTLITRALIMSTTTVTRVSQMNGDQTANPSNDGRGSFRGRGRGRGGRRGRGRGGSRSHQSSSRVGDDNSKESGSTTAHTEARENAPKPRLTHCQSRIHMYVGMLMND